MSKKRNEHIDQLLSDLKLLEERLLSVKESEALPFSFFSASFDRIEKISRLLHELELIQIGEMKEQMERLVRFLSESEARSSLVDDLPTESESVESADNQSVCLGEPDQYPDSREALSTGTENEDIVKTLEKEMTQERTGSTSEKIILPEYKDLRHREATIPPKQAKQAPPGKNGQDKSPTRSLNDIIQAPPALLDLKRGISLNDRFLFQRELFNNNRVEMNNAMEKLSTFGSFDEVENYLKNVLNWNFEDQRVKEFLLIVKKGFK